MGAETATGAVAAEKALLETMSQAPSSRSSNSRMNRKVGVPLVRAFGAYGRGRWSEAAEGLLRVRDSSHLFGGSHAQRDIVTLTLLDAALRAGRRALAAHILAERYAAKQHTPLTAFWRHRIGGA
jgi:hypothetical protein